MEWVVLIMFSGAVVLASLGLISMLFTEIFRGRHQSESPKRQGVRVQAAGITAEERASLTGSSSPGNLISRGSFLFRRKPVPPAAQENLVAPHKPQ
jgi:hypothetical protein